MEEAVRFNKDALIDELKQIHKDMVSVYTELFTYKYENNEDFRDFIEKEYRENGIGNDGKDKWNENFCHRTSYTLINKVLFIRICEDKGFMFNPEEDFIMGEPKDPNIGKKLSARGRDKWISLISNYTFGELLKFAFADMKESFKNIALFKEDKYEKLNPTKQELELKFMLDSKEYKKTPIYSYEENVAKIIEKLDTSKFDFNVPAEGNILGDVYEKFMDRETRKAIGQFYTPDFVIEYILNNTVAEADVVENPFVSVLDPACGSGHFLIMAYDILRKKFEENIDRLREKYADVDYVYKNENMKGKEYWVKDRIHYHILKHCIFGADIDSFAVQLTTINLLLKDLDNFTDELNIMECDSLIKWEEDYDWQDLKQQLKNISMFYTINYKDINGIHRHDTLSRDKAEKLVRLCEFWAKKYDYVVGNPPYIEVKKIKDDFKPYLRNRYMFNGEELIKGRYDIYWAFFKRAIDLINSNGQLAFITSISYLDAVSGDSLRKYMLKRCKISDITYVGKFSENVSVFTVITILEKTIEEDYTIQFNSIENNKFKKLFENKCSFYLNQPNQIIKLDNNNDVNLILKNIENNKKFYLEEIVYIQQGIILQNKVNKKEYFIHKNNDIGKLKPYIEGKDIDKYFLPKQHRYVYYDPKVHHRPRIPEIFDMPKLLIKRISNSIKSCFDQDGYYCMDNTIFTVSLYKDLDCIKKKYKRQLNYKDIYSENSKNYSYEYLLGIINSKCFGFYFDNKFKTVSLDALKKMPIPKMCFRYKDIVEKNSVIIQKNHSFIINRIEHLVEIIKHTKDIIADYCQFKTNVNNKIIENEMMILQIDLIVYHLYSLHKDEALKIEQDSIYEERKEFIRNYYDDFLNIDYIDFCKIYVNELMDKLDINGFINLIKDNSIYEIAEKYGYEYATVALLQETYVKEYGIQEPWKFYNLSELYTAVNEYLKTETIEILKHKNKYISLNDIRNTLKEKLHNFEELMNIMRKDNPTKKSNDIVKEALNQFADTWNSYIKNINAGKEPKKLVKYYDSTYYGLSEWDDEIHKEYFIDAIKKYTEINPNEKKARDILKLFEGLNIKDKEDYIEIFNSQIKKAFRK